MSRLVLRTIGDCVCELGGRRITPSARHLFAFVLYLGKHAGRAVGRQELATLLFGDAGDVSLHNLRQLIYRARKAGVTLSSDAAGTSLDVDEVHDDLDVLLRENAERRAASRIDCRFLPGYVPDLSAAMDEWLDQLRDSAQAAIRRALLGDVAYFRETGAWESLEHVAGLCLALDPLNEEATFARADAMALSGDRSGAIQLVAQFAAELTDSDVERDRRIRSFRTRMVRLGRGSGVASELPFTGREEQVGRLISALRSLGSGAKSALLLGEAGIGKSRLARQLCVLAELEGMVSVTHVVRRADLKRPLSMFTDLVDGLRALPGALGADPEQRSYLDRVTRSEDPAAPISDEAQDSPQLHRSIRSALVDLLAALGDERPLLLFLDGVEWLDVASWEVIRELHFTAAASRVMVVMTARHVPAHVVSDAPWLDRLVVPPMRESESVALTKAMLSDRARSDESLVSWCAQSAGGNPFFLQQLVRQWLESGTRSVPQDVGVLLRQRLESLSENGMTLLRSCAVLGVSSTIERLQRLLGLPEYALIQALQELEERRFLRTEGQRVRCAHDLVSEVVVRDTPASVLLVLHRGAAHLLESMNAESPLSHAAAWEAAQHWVSASDSGKAAAVVKRCSRKAVELGDASAACELLVLSSAIIAESTTSANLLDEAIAIGVSSDLDLANTDTVQSAITRRQALAMAVPMDAEVTSRLLIEQTLATARRVKDPESAFALLESFASDSKNHEQDRLRALSLGMALADRHYDEGRANVFNDLKHTLAFGSREADNISFDVIYCCGFACRSEALAHTNSLHELLSSQPFTIPNARLRTHVAYALFQLGYEETSNRMLSDLYSSATQRRMRALTAWIASMLADNALAQGYDEGAADWLNQAASHCAHSMTAHRDIVTLLMTAELAVQTGQYKSALDLVKRARRLCGGAPYRKQAIVIESLSALAAAQLGERMPAKKLSTLLATFDRHRTHSGVDSLMACVWRGLIDHNRTDAASKYLTEYLHNHRRDLSNPSALLTRTTSTDSAWRGFDITRRRRDILGGDYALLVR